MESEAEAIKIKPKNMFVPICVTQIVCVSVILIAVLIIKFFFESSYVKLQNWCEHNFLEETTISDVFDEEKTSET